MEANPKEGRGDFPLWLVAVESGILWLHAMAWTVIGLGKRGPSLFPPWKRPHLLPPLWPLPPCACRWQLLLFGVFGSSPGSLAAPCPLPIKHCPLTVRVALANQSTPGPAPPKTPHPKKGQEIRSPEARAPKPPPRLVLVRHHCSRPRTCIASVCLPILCISPPTTVSIDILLV